MLCCRSSVREEKADQVTVCKKQDSNLEYFTGKKRSKNKVKQKKQERTIDLTDLDRTHRQQQQLTGKGFSSCDMNSMQTYQVAIIKEEVFERS